jgi:putative transposase
MAKSLSRVVQHLKLPTMGTTRPHRKLVKHYHEPGDVHELTFSCYKRRPLLTNDVWRERLARCVDDAGQQTGIELAAFVFMPEHVHLIVVPSTTEPEIGRYLALIKQPFSDSIKQMLLDTNSPLVARLTVQERPGKRCFRFWQEGPGYDRNLRAAHAIEAAIDYVHVNPVRRGLVMQALDWKWSSAGWYLRDPQRQQFANLPFVHGLPVGSLDR